MGGANLGTSGIYNPRVTLAFRGLSQRYVRMHLMPAGRMRRATREHNALYEAWAAGDAREASRQTQSHIEETRGELSVLLERPKGR